MPPAAQADKHRRARGAGMMTKLLWIAAGGAAGSLARYGLSSLVAHWAGTRFPWGTFLINVLGCLFFGLLWAAIENLYRPAHGARLLLLTGFLGAFTTFSTFAFESAALLRAGQWAAAFANIAGQNLLGLAALFVGLWLGQSLVRP